MIMRKESENMKEKKPPTKEFAETLLVKIFLENEIQEKFNEMNTFMQAQIEKEKEGIRQLDPESTSFNTFKRQREAIVNYYDKLNSRTKVEDGSYDVLNSILVFNFLKDFSANYEITKHLCTFFRTTLYPNNSAFKAAYTQSETDVLTALGKFINPPGQLAKQTTSLLETATFPLSQQSWANSSASSTVPPPPFISQKQAQAQAQPLRRITQGPGPSSSSSLSSSAPSSSSSSSRSEPNSSSSSASANPPKRRNVTRKRANRTYRRVQRLRKISNVRKTRKQMNSTRRRAY
jgi:hypothetical protein